MNNKLPAGGRARKEYRRKAYENGANWSMQRRIAGEIEGKKKELEIARGEGEGEECLP